MNKFYKIKHLPTGLYFRPSRYRNNSNLSKKGKVYQQKPNLAWLKYGYYHPDDVKNSYSRPRHTRPYIESEWEIVEIELKTS